MVPNLSLMYKNKMTEKVFFNVKKIGIFAAIKIITIRGDIKSPLFIVKNDASQSSRTTEWGVRRK